MDRKKVLVIEDETVVRESIIEILSQNNFQAYSASNGKDGIDFLREIKPDLVLCDIMMPKLDGYCVLEIIRQDKDFSNTPFIFLTAKSNMEDLREGMIKGADDYINKPFKASELIESINTRLKLRENIFAQKISANNGDLHKDKILVSIAGIPNIIKFSEIIGIKGLAEYTNVYLKTGKKIVIRKLLKHWEQLLPDNKFVRIHKSSIINYDHIKKISKHLKRSFKVEMENCEDEFIISERYASKLRDRLKF